MTEEKRMTRDDTIVKQAAQAGVVLGFGLDWDALARFAALVAAAEREACAKVIESHGPFLANGAMLAEAIRARSNT